MKNTFLKKHSNIIRTIIHKISLLVCFIVSLLVIDKQIDASNYSILIPNFISILTSIILVLNQKPQTVQELKKLMINEISDDNTSVNDFIETLSEIQGRLSSRSLPNIRVPIQNTPKNEPHEPIEDDVVRKNVKTLFNTITNEIEYEII